MQIENYKIHKASSKDTSSSA